MYRWHHSHRYAGKTLLALTCKRSGLLFFGRQVLLRQDGGIIDGEAIAYLVAEGELAATPMIAIPWT